MAYATLRDVVRQNLVDESVVGDVRRALGIKLDKASPMRD